MQKVILMHLVTMIQSRLELKRYLKEDKKRNPLCYPFLQKITYSENYIIPISKITTLLRILFK